MLSLLWEGEGGGLAVIVWQAVGDVNKENIVYFLVYLKGLFKEFGTKGECDQTT